MPNNIVNIYQNEDTNGNPVASRTPESAVYDEDGVTLDVKLQDLNLVRVQSTINAAKNQAIEQIQATYDGGFTRS